MGRKKPLCKVPLSTDSVSKLSMWNRGHSWYEDGDAHVVDWASIMEESTDESESSDASDQETSASAKKIKLHTPDNDHKYSPCRAIIEIALLQEIVKSVAPICSTCTQGNLTVEISQHIGLATEIVYVCSNTQCSKNKVSKEATFCMASKQGPRYDINKCLVLCMRDISFLSIILTQQLFHLISSPLTLTNISP